MGMRACQFLRSWILAFSAFVILTAIFNSIIDPYLLLNMPRIVGLNARKPAVDTQQRLMKAYDVLRARPRTLILGSSGAALGMNASDPAWPEEDRPVYNLAFGEGSPYMAYRYLQHVASQSPVSTVILGLDFEYFLTNFHSDNRKFESHLAVRRDGSANPSEQQYIRDLFQNTFAIEALNDSVATLAANFRGSSSDLRMGNWEWSDLGSRLAAWGVYAQFAMSDVLVAPLYHGRHRDPAAMADITALLNLCESMGTRVILFISPVHADELELLDLAGQWTAFEQWKRELTALAAKNSAGAGGRSLSLWDFTGYNLYTTESVSTPGPVLRWFLEPDHYSRELGNVIVRRMFGGGNVDFGALLTPATIDSHMDEIRMQRFQYRKLHAADARRLRDLYNLAMGIPAESKLQQDQASLR